MLEPSVTASASGSPTQYSPRVRLRAGTACPRTPGLNARPAPLTFKLMVPLGGAAAAHGLLGSPRGAAVAATATTIAAMIRCPSRAPRFDRNDTRFRPTQPAFA